MDRIGDWSGLGGCLDVLKISENFTLCEIDERFLGHPAHSTVFM
jgi:hypothetical protein